MLKGAGRRNLQRSGSHTASRQTWLLLSGCILLSTALLGHLQSLGIFQKSVHTSKHTAETRDRVTGLGDFAATSFQLFFLEADLQRRSWNDVALKFQSCSPSLLPPALVDLGLHSSFLLSFP